MSEAQSNGGLARADGSVGDVSASFVTALHAITDAAGIGVWELELSTRTLIVSPTCKLNFGRALDRPFTYDELLAAVHPDDKERMQGAVAHTIATGDDYRIEYRVVRPDEQLAWVQIHAKLERDAAGQPARMRGTSHDITDNMLSRRRSEVLLSLDKYVFSVVLDPVEIAYRAAEALGQALDVSRAGYGLIDITEETVTIERDWSASGIAGIAGRTLQFRQYGSYIEDLMRGETVVIADTRRDPRTESTAEALAGLDIQSLVNVPVAEAGGLVAVLYLNHATPRPWSEDEIALMREVAHRIRLAVERRRAEQELRDMAAGLERQVQERTAMLMQTEAQLRQSQKMEAVGQLTGGLAHDFNNLLGNISGSLEVLKRMLESREDPSIARLIEIGQSSTKRAAALTHRLLAFSRRQTLEPKALDVNRLVSSFKEFAGPTIGPEVTLEVTAGDSVWAVRADPTQLENALLNLCINGRDAMPGGGRLTIETSNRYIDTTAAAELQVEAGRYVSICMTDEGVGMPPDVLARAFDPFFTTKPIGAGTGLGLSMVYGFAQQSGGQVRIDSVVGQGTSVCILLPRLDAGVEEFQESESSPAAILGTGETILIVDDEAALRSLMSGELDERGYRVLEAEDGAQAMQLIRRHSSIRLLVTDVGLPGGMNGRQVAEAAREVLPGLPTLFVTGYAETAVLSDANLLPNMHVMAKPFELSAFGQRVQGLLKASARNRHQPND